MNPANTAFPTILFCIVAFAQAARADPPRADLERFRGEVAPLLKRLCVDCHGPDDPEGQFNLSSVNSDVLQGDSLEVWRMVYEQIRFGDMPPKDADQPTAAQRDTILQWIRGELLKTQWPGVVVDQKLLLPQFGNYVDHAFLFGNRQPRVIPAPPRIWRLRPDIYEQGVRSTQLFEGQDALANGLSVLDGPDFKDYAAAYFIDEAGAAPLLGNAKKLAAAMLSQQRGKSPELKALTDDGGSPGKEAVGRAIDTVFARVLGRHSTSAEQQRFAAFYETAKAKSNDKIAAHALVTAILMQPEFFFRLELGDGQPDEFGRVRLTQREIAYALSYALGDAPDNGFLSLAHEGKLSTSEAVADAVRNRLERSAPRVQQFFREYFHYPFANEVFKDQPSGGEHNARMLIADLETSIAPILREDKDVLARLLTTRKFYVNAEYTKGKDGTTRLVPRDARSKKYQTAFNLPIDWKWGVHLQPVEFAEGERCGVLTHPAWLTAWSGNFENHPVQRGKWIRTHLLGGTVPDVPIGVDARVPEKEHTTFRDRLKMATGAAECWRCHRNMDPLGVVFERYDHYGRYQRKDAGQPVDASGEITRTGVPELDGRAVGGPAELMEILAHSEHVEQVFTRHAFRFFLGRNETLGDANTLQDAHRAYQENDGSFKAMVVALLSSDSFLLRQLPISRQED